MVRTVLALALVLVAACKTTATVGVEWRGESLHTEGFGDGELDEVVAEATEAAREIEIRPLLARALDEARARASETDAELRFDTFDLDRIVIEKRRQELDTRRILDGSSSAFHSTELDSGNPLAALLTNNDLVLRVAVQAARWPEGEGIADEPGVLLAQSEIAWTSGRNDGACDLTFVDVLADLVNAQTTACLRRAVAERATARDTD